MLEFLKIHEYKADRRCGGTVGSWKLYSTRKLCPGKELKIAESSKENIYNVNIQFCFIFINENNFHLMKWNSKFSLVSIGNWL